VRGGRLFPILSALLLGAAPAAASEPADAVRYPYIAAFSRVSGGDRVYFCAGTLIHERWVLTAAHCFHSTSGARISNRGVYAAVGQDRLAAADDTVQVGVERVFIHPDYDPRTQHRDIALVRLADIAGPLIADAGGPMPRAATVLGFGSYYEGRLAANALSRTGAPTSQLSDRLRRAAVLVVDPARCAELGGDGDDWATCGSAGPSDACVGDSGGPLVAEAMDGPDRLVGLVSLGSGCAVAEPVVRYTLIEPYEAWIAETIQQVEDLLE
jgi:secreted trypsin-like serine protease